MRTIKGSPDFQLLLFWELGIMIWHSVWFIFGEKIIFVFLSCHFGIIVFFKINWFPWHYCRKDANVNFIRIIWWTSVRLGSHDDDLFCFNLIMCLVLFWWYWLNNYCDCRRAEWAMHPLSLYIPWVQACHFSNTAIKPKELTVVLWLFLDPRLSHITVLIKSSHQLIINSIWPMGVEMKSFLARLMML